MAMENLHKSATRSWISKAVNVKAFRDEWKKLDDSYKLKGILNKEDYDEIKQACSCDASTFPDQLPTEIYKRGNISDYCNLETLSLQQVDLLKRKNDSKYADIHKSRKIYNYPDYLNNDLENKDQFVPIKKPEVCLTVQIFRPAMRVPDRRITGSPVFHIDQEFMVLGSQCLTELRDKIDCVSDKAIPGDFSENPNQPVDYTCKDLYKSGFFCIAGTFYNDMRDPNCKDYSEVIMKWAENKKRGIGPFQKQFMEQANFIDLEIQLGYPYVYVHQGNCEHFVVFSDLVMLNSHHDQNRNHYPLHVTVIPKKLAFCMLCHKHEAAWIVHGSKRVPETPFYFCKSCFFSFNYDENNQKIGDFVAYHHIDRSTIV